MSKWLAAFARGVRTGAREAFDEFSFSRPRLWLFMAFFSPSERLTLAYGIIALCLEIRSVSAAVNSIKLVIEVEQNGDVRSKPHP